MKREIMTRTCEPPTSAGESADGSPFLVEFYLVQGTGFRCMAYRDQQGTWRNAFSNDELFGDIQILE